MNTTARVAPERRKSRRLPSFFVGTPFGDNGAWNSQRKRCTSSSNGAAPAKFAASIALNVLLPGSPVVVSLVGKALDCVHESVKDNLPIQTTGRDVVGIEKVVEFLHTDLRDLVKSVEAHHGSQNSATQAVEKALANQQAVQQTALDKLDSLVHQFDALKKQNERLLKEQGFMGGMMEDMMVPLVERVASVADLVQELNARPVPFSEFVRALRCYHHGSRALVEGKNLAAKSAFETLAQARPTSATAAIAWATSKALDCDLDAAQMQLGRAARLKGGKDANLTHLCEVVEKVSSMKVLRLKNLPDITDSTLHTFRSLSKLQELNLQGCTKFTDVGLANLSALTRLKKLSLRACRQLTDDGFAKLWELAQSLEDLNLMDTAISDKALAGLGVSQSENAETNRLCGRDRRIGSGYPKSPRTKERASSGNARFGTRAPIIAGRESPLMNAARPAVAVGGSTAIRPRDALGCRNKPRIMGVNWTTGVITPCGPLGDAHVFLAVIERANPAKEQKHGIRCDAESGRRELVEHSQTTSCFSLELPRLRLLFPKTRSVGINSVDTHNGV